MHQLYIMLLCVASGSALARNSVAVTVYDLSANPRTYIGTSIKVHGIRCVDPGKAGFLCVASMGNSSLRVEAPILGPSTALPIAERLIGSCKGQSALNRPECQVDISITPTAFEQSEGRSTLTTIYASQIEMYDHIRR